MTDAARHVLVQDQDGVRSIVLNRAAKANALTAAMLQRIIRAFQSATADGAQAIVLRSASKTLFSAGADIQEFSEGAAQLDKHGGWLRKLMGEMACCPLPILAAARGRAAGAGAILLSMVDILIAADDLTLVCPEIAFNMYPFIVQAALETKISAGRARQLCFSASPLSAASALELGLATELVARDRFDEVSAERLAYYLSRRDALQMARKGRLLMESPKDFMNKLEALEPLMHENFGKPGVQDSMKAYFQRLGAKAK